MLTYLNQSTTAVIILHEIYGINEHITMFSQTLSKQGFDVFSPDMTKQDLVYNYNQEAEAYQNFIENVGFEKAFNTIRDFILSIRNQYENIIIIGFSIGATVAWMCGQQPNLCDAIVCYYGSRIRDYMDILPACPALLFFPIQEKSFSIADLINKLQGTTNIIIKQYIGMHGFANPFSPAYKKKASDQAFLILLEFIKQQSHG